MHILTLDIEEWYIEKMYHGGRQERYNLFDRTLDKTLQLLSDNGITATFFCVGQMARHFPEVIKRIVEGGHEIGCHSNVHTWLNKMTIDECREDTRIAVDTLEQCIGKKIKSYRAPAFSITEQNTWAFEILVENGIERDASIFPTSRDFGGFSDFGSKTPCIVSYNGITIKEFPVSPVNFLGHQIVYSGGGYFRVFPEIYIKHMIKKSNYTMLYFHIKDLASIKSGFMTRSDYEEYFKEKGSLIRRIKRYFKANFAIGNTFEKFKSVVYNGKFLKLEQIDETIKWDNLKRIIL